MSERMRREEALEHAKGIEPRPFVATRGVEAASAAGAGSPQGVILYASKSANTVA
jgi:hypothetical protein